MASKSLNSAGATTAEQPRRRGGPAVGLALGALGVVFGDIGTSPLYALQTVFSIDNGAVRPVPGDVYGVISLVFWSILVIGTCSAAAVADRIAAESRRFDGPATLQWFRTARAALVEVGI